MTRGRELGPAYRRLVASSAFSNLADGVLQLTLPLLALELTGSPSAVAGVAAVYGLPWLVFALHAGALADRRDRRRLMVAAQLGRVSVVGGLAVLVATDAASGWMLYPAAFTLGTLETLFDTSAQAIMPAVVDPSDLTRANGRLFAVESTMHQFVGPPVGGALVAVGVALSLGTSAACFLVADFVLTGVSGSFRPASATAATRLREDIVEGLLFLWHHRLLRRLTVVGAVSNACITGAFALLPALVVAPGPMELSELGYGLLLALPAAGSLAGSFVVEAAERALGRRRLLVTSVAVNGTAVALLGTGELAVAAPVGLVLGMGGACWNVVVVSLRQRIVPDHLLGRVGSASRMVTWGAMPVGAAVGAALVRVLDVRTVFALSGTVVLLLDLGVRGLDQRDVEGLEDRVPVG